MESRKQLPTLLAKDKPANVVEIGVFAGDYADIYIPQLPPNSHIWLVDTWPLESGERHFQDTAAAYEKVLDKYSKNPNIHIVKMLSLEAAMLFENLFFDWIYLDALHGYRHVIADIRAWFPKCRGLMSGHDYVTLENYSKARSPGFNRFGVRKAVREFFGDNFELTQDSPFQSWYTKRDVAFL
jgi:hypothetical protein